MTKRRRRTAPKHLALLRKARPFYESILQQQGGGCHICGRPPSPNRRLDTDHDHKRMFVRGLLCVRCNRALPAWITPKWLRAAADYLDLGDHLGLNETSLGLTSTTRRRSS